MFVHKPDQPIRDRVKCASPNPAGKGNIDSGHRCGSFQHFFGCSASKGQEQDFLRRIFWETRKDTR